MTDGNLRLKVDANAQRAEQNLARLTNRINKLENQLGRVTKSGTEMKAKGTLTFQGMVQGAASVAAGYMGIHTAVEMVNVAIEEQGRLRQQAREASREVSNQKLDLNLQLLDLAPLQRAKLKQDLIDIGVERGVMPQDILAVGKQTFSLTGGDDPNARIDQTLKTIESLARLMGHRIADFPAVGGASIALQDSLKIPADQAAKFSAIALSQASMHDPEMMQTLVRTISGNVAVLKDVPVEMRQNIADATLGLFAVMQRLTADTIGATASTTISNLVSQAARASGRRDLTPEQLMDLVDPGDALLKIKGKSFTRDIQPEFLRDGGLVDQMVDSVIKGVKNSMARDISDLYREQEGAFDPQLAANNELRRSEAAKAAQLLRMKSPGADAITTVMNRMEMTNASSLQKAAMRRMLEFETHGVDQLQAAETMARTMLISELARQHQKDSPAGGFTPLALERVRFFKYSDRELMRMPGDEGVKAAQDLMRSIEKILAAQHEERKLLNQVLLDRFGENDAKLKESVGEAIGTSARNSRVSSEEEN